MTTTAVRGRDFHQVQQPFELPNAVALPSGERFEGGRARVYWLLRLTANRSFEHSVGLKRGPAGWVPDFLLLEPWAGGSEGKRRLRELRDYGFDYQHERFQAEGSDGAANTMLYRLTRDPLAGGETRPSAPPAPAVTFRRLPPPGAEAVAVRDWVEAHEPPSTRLRFWTYRGEARSGPNPICLSPGRSEHRHFLTPDLMTASSADYLAQLRYAFEHRPEFHALLGAPHETTFWVHSSTSFDPLPDLVHALEHCGAVHLGEWIDRAGGVP
jgi:hypothetical protein